MPQFALCEARRDGDAVEDAEAHRGARTRVVARRPHEGEALLLDGADRRAGGEEGGRVRGLGADRVGIEQHGAAGLGRPPHRLDVVAVVAGLQLSDRGRPGCEYSGKACQEHAQALLSLRVVARRVEAREVRMADDRFHGGGRAWNFYRRRA